MARADRVGRVTHQERQQIRQDREAEREEDAYRVPETIAPDVPIEAFHVASPTLWHSPLRVHIGIDRAGGSEGGGASGGAEGEASKGVCDVRTAKRVCDAR